MENPRGIFKNKNDLFLDYEMNKNDLFPLLCYFQEFKQRRSI